MRLLRPERKQQVMPDMPQGDMQAPSPSLSVRRVAQFLTICRSNKICQKPYLIFQQGDNNEHDQSNGIKSEKKRTTVG